MRGVSQGFGGTVIYWLYASTSILRISVWYNASRDNTLRDNTSQDNTSRDSLHSFLYVAGNIVVAFFSPIEYLFPKTDAFPNR